MLGKLTFRSILILMFALVFQIEAAEEVRVIRSSREIPFDQLPSNSLILFDVDEVLVTPADALLRPMGDGFTGWEEVAPDRFDEILSFMLANTQYALVDEEAPQIIHWAFFLIG